MGTSSATGISSLQALAAAAAVTLPASICYVDTLLATSVPTTADRCRASDSEEEEWRRRMPTTRLKLDPPSRSETLTDIQHSALWRCFYRHLGSSTRIGDTKLLEVE